MRRTALCLIMAAAAYKPLPGQTADQLLTQARQAFQNIDFEQAARLFTRVLDAAVGATAAQRDTAQLYLGVSYEYAGQRANALSAFRALVRSSPCTPSPEQYGAGVTAAYVEAQGGVFATGVCEIRRQEVTRETGVTFQVTTTRPAVVRALLLDSAGRSVADLGEVDATGAASLRWTALPDPSELPASPTRHQLVIRARATQGTETDERAFRVTVYAPPADTADHPPAPNPTEFRPEQRPLGPALGDFGKAVAVGAAAVLASSVIADKSLAGETGKALVVGGAISFAGFVALVKGSNQRNLSENIQFNAELRRAWETKRDSVAAVNRDRRTNRRIVIEPAAERP